MADTYCNFEELANAETSGVDYRILVRQAALRFAIVAPHGGGIEPGTSEIADAIAGNTAEDDDRSFYAFEGVKSQGNAILHITSTKFDEPKCFNLIFQCERVITIHGEQSAEGEGVFVGGLDDTLGALLTDKLKGKGFDAKPHTSSSLQGREKDNLCNRGTTGAGVQLELSHSVRLTMFDSLSKEGRKHRKPRFDDFVNAILLAL
jgi:phage replication-related protein YjqB (UPF0714/DUF867 family)